MLVNHWLGLAFVIWSRPVPRQIGQRRVRKRPGVDLVSIERLPVPLQMQHFADSGERGPTIAPQRNARERFFCLSRLIGRVADCGRSTYAFA